MFLGFFPFCFLTFDCSSNVLTIISELGLRFPVSISVFLNDSEESKEEKMEQRVDLKMVT